MCPLCRPALGPASHRTLKSSSRPSCSFVTSRDSLIFHFRSDHNTTETLGCTMAKVILSLSYT